MQCTTKPLEFEGHRRDRVPNLGTLLNNWNKPDRRFCNPLAVKVLEWFAWRAIYAQSQFDFFQHPV